MTIKILAGFFFRNSKKDEEMSTNNKLNLKKEMRREPTVQFSSVAQSCPTLCDPMNCSTPGLPAHQQLLEFTQTHVH